MSALRAKAKRVSGSSAAALAAAAAANADDSGDATAPVDAASASKTAEVKGDGAAGAAKAKVNGVHSPPAPAARPNGTSPPTKLGDAKGMGGSGFALGKAGRQASGLGLLSPPRKLPTKEEYFAKMETALRGMLTPFNSVFELEDAFWALNEYARHLIERGDDAKVRTISTANIHFVEHCSRLKGMPEMLDALGFRPSDGSAAPAAYVFDAALLSLAPVVSEAARAAAIAAAAQAKAAREAGGNEDLDADDEAARAAARTYAPGATVPLPAFCSALSLFRRLLVIEADALGKRVAELPFRLQSDHEYTACAAVGQASDQGPRREMEDEEVVAEPFYAGNGLDAKEQRAAYFGLYDGHGGRQAVEFVVKALHVNFESIVARNPDGNYKDLFREAYLTTDGQLRRRAIHESGCTSISVYLRHMPLPSASSAAAAAGAGEAGSSSSSTSANGLLQVPGARGGSSADEKKKSHRHTRSSSSFGSYGGFGTGSGPSQRRLYVANAGDARVVLVRAGGRAERLSYDHKPDLAEEMERIEADGGEVRNKRVAGCLAVSRALGDHRGFKDEHDWVSAEPFVREIAVRDDDLFVVLACDGVWDVMDDAEVAEFVSAKVKAAEMDNESAPAADRVGPNALMDAVAKALVARALEKESSDNVTAMIVRL